MGKGKVGYHALSQYMVCLYVYDHNNPVSLSAFSIFSDSCVVSVK